MSSARHQYLQMNASTETKACKANPSIAILGVPFDNVTTVEAAQLVHQMIASRQPHYLVTANVDFLVQAQADVELRRILFDAHLVLCDGTPLVWASRLLGNPLPERVAGADFAPLLIRIASEKNYRLFFLGGTPESTAQALANIKAKYPQLSMAGYSPPFNKLLEMDHDQIKRRIQRSSAGPLICFVRLPQAGKMDCDALSVTWRAGVRRCWRNHRFPCGTPKTRTSMDPTHGDGMAFSHVARAAPAFSPLRDRSLGVWLVHPGTMVAVAVPP